ncbi:MAG: hypothetical protein ACRCYP_03580 [Alphaproteobacteria bacterium]
MPYSWFRFHHNLFDSNTHFKRLSKAEKCDYIHLYHLASHSEKRDGEIKLDDESLAFELDLETEDWLTFKAKLRAKGFIEYLNGGIKINSWERDQYVSDSSTERVRAHRQRKKDATCNGDETFHVVSMKQHETPPDQKQIQKTDPETDPGLERDSFVDAREGNGQDSLPPPHKKQENDNQVLLSVAFGTVERTPWLKNGDPNSIDDGFVKFIQGSLEGRGAYENRKPSVADAKGYIRAFTAKIRGSEERRHLYLRITDLWQEFCAEGESPSAIEKAVVQEMKRLKLNAVLPQSFQERFGVLMCRDLTTEQLKEYLTWLKAQSVQGFVCQN